MQKTGEKMKGNTGNKGEKVDGNIRERKQEKKKINKEVD